MRARSVVALFALLSVLLLACGPNLGPAATATPLPPPPTNTPSAEKVTEAAATNTPKPIEKPAPTDTPQAVDEEPTATRAAQQQGGIVKKPTPGEQAQGSQGSSVFEFKSHTAWADDAGNLSIVGEVVNISDQTVDTLVSIECVLKDENGQVVQGDFGAYLDRPAIPPGEKSSFWVLITSDQLGGVDANSITDYELTLYISEDPSPDVELTVLSAETSQDSDGFYIKGTVENQTDQTFASLSVYSTIYDADGNVMNVTLDIIDLSPSNLGPGEQADFTGWFVDHFDGEESFTVVVTGWAESPGGDSQGPSTDSGMRSGAGILEVQSHTSWANDDGSVSIVGEAYNVSDQTLDTVIMVEALLTDSGGNKVEGEFTAYVDRPVIPPGEKSSFWIYISPDQLGGVAADSVSDYELLFWISGDPSPDVELKVTDASGGEESDGYYINGTVENQTDLEYTVLTVYSTLYDADGNVINATLDMINLDVPLAPGAQADFTGYFPDHYQGADSWYVFVTGYTADAAGQ